MTNTDRRTLSTDYTRTSNSSLFFFSSSKKCVLMLHFGYFVQIFDSLVFEFVLMNGKGDEFEMVVSVFFCQFKSITCKL